MHPAVREYVLPKIEEIKKIIPLRRETKLLDVGSGNGFFGFHFDKLCDTTCVDYSEAMIASNPVMKKKVMDANCLDFPENSFDVVFCHALLHHVDDFDRVVREMKRVSRGHVVIMEPNRNNPLMFLFSLLVKEENKALRFSLSYLKRKVAANGMKIVSAFSYGLMVPNKAPTVLLPFFRLFNAKFSLGMTNIIVAEKEKEEDILG